MYFLEIHRSYLKLLQKEKFHKLEANDVITPLKSSAHNQSNYQIVENVMSNSCSSNNTTSGVRQLPKKMAYASTGIDTGDHPWFFSMLPIVSKDSINICGEISCDDEFITKHDNKCAEHPFLLKEHQCTFQIVKSFYNHANYDFISFHSKDVSEIELLEIDEVMTYIVRNSKLEYVKSKFIDTYLYLLLVENKQQGAILSKFYVYPIKYTNPSKHYFCIHKCMNKQNMYAAFQCILLELDFCKSISCSLVSMHDNALKKCSGKENSINIELNFFHFLGVLLNFVSVKEISEPIINDHYCLFKELLEFAEWLFEGNDKDSEAVIDTNKDFQEPEMNICTNSKKNFLQLHKSLPYLNGCATKHFMPEFLRNYILQRKLFAEAQMICGTENNYNDAGEMFAILQSSQKVCLPIFSEICICT